MKVAIASDDGLNISQHFGRARFYIIYTIENDKVTAKEVRDKVGHHSFIEGHGAGSCHDHGAQGEHGTDAASQTKHQSMLNNARDCQYILAGHMGGGAFRSIVEGGIVPILTDMKDPDEIIKAMIEDRLENQTDRLH
jgi:predicted Fe-Mo cluster-binding NifX family protein